MNEFAPLLASASASMARVLLHEAEEAVERDAVRAASLGSTADPWTPEQLLSMALVHAVLAVAEAGGGVHTAVGGRGRVAGSALPRRLKRPIRASTVDAEDLSKRRNSNGE